MLLVRILPRVCGMFFVLRYIAANRAFHITLAVVSCKSPAAEMLDGDNVEVIVKEGHQSKEHLWAVIIVAHSQLNVGCCKTQKSTVLHLK